MLAAERLRTPNTRSGISGRGEKRPSIARNTPSSASPIAIGTSACAEPQPWSSVLTMPNVSSMRPAVT